MKKLSKREWILIYIMAVMVILVGGILLLINPAIDKNNELDLKLITLREEEQTVRMTIEQKPIYSGDITEYNNKIKTLRKSLFLAYMENEDLDETVTVMVLQSGMIPQDLTVSPMSIDQIKPYGSSVSADETQEATEESGTAEESGNGDAEAALNEAESTDLGSAAAKADKVTFKATGTAGNFIALMRIIRETKGIRLTAFDCSRQDAEKITLMDSLNGAKAAVSNKFIAEVTVEIYQNNN